MTDDLRTRIAAIIDREVDGFWEPLDVADVLIRELKLTQEQRELMDGMCGQSINYTTGKVTNHYRAATKQYRYVTEWTADE